MKLKKKEETNMDNQEFNFDFGTTQVSKPAQQETTTESKEFVANRGIFGEYDLTKMKSNFSELEDGEYAAKPYSLTIKLVNGAPVADLKYQVQTGDEKGKIATSTQ